MNTRQSLDISLVTIEEILGEVESEEEKTSEICDKLCDMATKQDIQELMRCTKSRKSFQPTGFIGKTSENARELMCTLENYCKLNNMMAGINY